MMVIELSKKEGKSMGPVMAVLNVPWTGRAWKGNATVGNVK